MVNGRIECVFSRQVMELPDGMEGTDLNLNNSYYIFIGMGEVPGMCGCVQ